MSFKCVSLALSVALATACARPALVSPGPAHAGATETSAVPSAIESARAFFARYVGLIEHPDLAFVDLYSDHARVHTLRHFPDGTTATREMTGRQWKRNLRQMYRRVNLRGDPHAAEAFSEIEFTESGEGLRVSAHRYVRGSCAEDRAFSLLLAPSPDGGLRIVEESSETWAQSMCGIGEGKSLEQRMDELVAQVESALPFMVDAETRLEGVRRQGKQLHHSYVLIAAAEGGPSQSEIEAAKFEALRRMACASANMRAVLEAGGELGYTYVDREGRELGHVSFGLEACKAEPSRTGTAEGGRVG